MQQFKEQQYNLKTDHVGVRDGYYMAKVFVDGLSGYPQVKEQAGNEINDDLINRYANLARKFIWEEKRGKRFLKKGVSPRTEYFQEHIPNAESKDKMLVNVGMMVEMHRAGYGDLDYYWQKIRFYAKDRGGYYRNPKLGIKYSSTHYEKFKALKDLGFITHNRVLNYRKITMKYSPIQKWVAVDRNILESKKTYKSFLLAVTEAYQLEGSYKNSLNKVTKFDHVKRKWNRKQYKRSSLFDARKLTFNDSHSSFLTGRVSDSCLASFLSSPKYKTSITTKTLQRWRKNCRFNNYNTIQLFIPIKGLKFKDKKYRKNSKLYSYGKNQVYLTHMDRKVFTAIPIFGIKSLKTRYLLELYNGSYSKESLPYIGTDFYTPEDTNLLDIKKSIGKKKSIIFELSNDDTQKVSATINGNNLLKSHKAKKNQTSLGHKKGYHQFKKNTLKKTSSKNSKEIKKTYRSDSSSFVPSNEVTNEECSIRRDRKLLMN